MAIQPTLGETALPIAFGTVVQPWKAVTDGQPAPQLDADRFAAVDTPGYVKVAFNIKLMLRIVKCDDERRPGLVRPPES